MKTALVMGGGTFVSASLAKHLIMKEYCVDILTRGIKQIDYSGYREHIHCDRTSAEQMRKALSGRSYDIVFDISAYTSSDVEILMDAIDKRNIQKYIFCSSGAVYKHQSALMDEEQEATGGVLWGKYGSDKRRAEECLIGSGIPYIIFRPTYIYGESNNLYREAYFFESIEKGSVIPIPSGNHTQTQFIHIEDLVKSFESATASKKTNRIYNITHPEVITWQEYVEKCGAAVKKKPEVRKIDVSMNNIEPRSYFPFRDVTYLLDIQRLVKDGLHVPEITLTDGLERTYRWYKDNRTIKVDEKMNRGIAEVLSESYTGEELK